MLINKKLLVLKAFCFFLNAAPAPVSPYLPVIAMGIGYSATSIGIMMTVIPLLSLLTKPFIGSIADKFSLHKAVFLILLMINAFGYLSIQWTTGESVDRSVNVNCTYPPTVLIKNNERPSDHCYEDKTKFPLTSFECELNCDYSIDLRGAPGTPLSNSVPVMLKYVHTELDTMVFNVRTRETHNQTGNASFCATAFGVQNCDLFCIDPKMSSLIVKELNENAAQRRPVYWVFGLLVILSKVAYNNCFTIGDTICLKLLGDRPQDFGFQRLFGAAGWGLCAMISGYLLDWFSQGESTTNFTICIYFSFALYLCNFLVTYCMKFEREEKSASIFFNVKSAILGDPQFILFLIVSIFCGACSGLLWNFLFLYVEEIAAEDICGDVSWVKSLEGTILFVHTFAGEIPFFIISGWLIKRIGHTNCTSLVLLAFAGRFILFYFIKNPWWILPIEAINGVTYALYAATAATYANMVAPPGTQATVQSVASGAFEGLGVSLGTICGGLIIDRWGGRICFLMAGLSSLVLGVIYTALQLCLKRRLSKQKLPPVSEEKK